MYQAHKLNPDIKELIAVKGCPPSPNSMLKALRKAGIDADPGLFENMDQLSGFFLSRYKDRPEFDESFFRVEE
jgi:coenzyme F420-reducing hydrogenase gamma subunit